MGAHRGTRRFDILLGDGVVNALMFLIDASEVVLPLGVGAEDAADASARNDACAQRVHEVGEVVVLGGAGNFPDETGGQPSLRLDLLQWRC
jgi:hypothetical protein